MVNSGLATVTQHFTKAMLRALPPEVAAAEPLRTLITDIETHERVPMALQDELWRQLVQHLPQAGLGLTLGAAIEPGNLDLVGFLIMSCDTLEDALDVLLTYHPIVGEGGEFLSTRNDTTCQLIYAPFHDVCRIERTEAVMTTLVHLTRHLTSGRFHPAYVSFQHEIQSTEKHYADTLQCPVRFGQMADAMVFPLTAMSLPIEHANAMVYEQMRKLADTQLQQLSTPMLAHQVEQLVALHPHWGKERIAGDLGMSGRHLNRLLARENTTFKILADQVRLQLAKDRLIDGEKTAEIAHATGFSDESSFTKAFKRLTGQTPTEFKAQVNEG
ncbi:AraC family transcriptional regulator [Salinispirillum sp. LH 10-3-1]|uniref:AraC family transcriptional regulator n=1 Tax=Salinispirillum sp. LH 10-3-1 TaxID=2952525 RepID=A0AB38YHR3_9GAMM